MTIMSKQKVPDAAKNRPEMIADALLNDAWSLELGDDKVSSLISRVPSVRPSSGRKKSCRQSYATKSANPESDHMCLNH